jgi:YcxB-like protein
MSLDMAKNGETTIEVEITEADVIDFRLYHLSHSRAVRRAVWISVSVILLAWAGVVGPMVFDSPKPQEAAKSLWPLLCFPALFLVIFFSLQKRRLKRLSKRVLREGRNRTMFGRMSITLSSQGVREVGEFSNTFVQWKAVEKVVVTASSIYIYLSTASAVIVPKRCFQSDADFKHFAAVAQEYLASCDKADL